MAFHISLQSDTSDILCDYSEGIDLRGGYEVCLKSFVAYNNIPNIGTGLNNFQLNLIKDVYEEEEEEEEEKENEVTVDSSEQDDADHYVILTVNQDSDKEKTQKKKKRFIRSETRVIIFDTGCYELKDIQRVIMSDKLHSEHNTTMIVDDIHMRVGIKSLWTLDMTSSNTIGRLLGFEKRVYQPSGDYIWSTLPVQLFTVNNIRIKTNLTRCNVRNDNVHDSTLYEFPLSVSPTEKIIERPIDPEYYKVITERLHHLRVIIVDQNDNMVNFRGEKNKRTFTF